MPHVARNIVLALTVLLLIAGVYFLFKLKTAPPRTPLVEEESESLVRARGDLDNGIITTEEFDDGVASPALRLELNFLMRESIGMTLKTARAAYAESPSLTASRKIAQKNNQQIAVLIGGIYTTDIEDSLLEILEERLLTVEDYATSLKKGDAEATENTKENLVAVARDLRELLRTTNSNLDEAQLEQRLSDDARLLQASVDTYANGDFGESYTHESDAYENISVVSDMLSQAISTQFPDKYPDDANDQTAEFESHLNARLREDINSHLDLMRGSFDQSDTQGAARAQSERNNTNIAQIMSDVYGKDNGDIFLNLWSTRTTLFVEYANAVASGEKNRIDAVDTKLGQYALIMAQFFASTNTLLPEKNLETLFLTDTQLMRDALDAYSTNNYQQSLEIEHNANVHIGNLGRTLTTNIIVEFPGRIEGESDVQENL